MTEFLASDAFETIMGGVIVIFVIALAIKMGPLRFLGEMLVHFIIKVVFVILVFGLLFLFARTGIGEKLGGVGTGLVVLLGLPFVWLAVSLVRAWLMRSPASDAKEAESDD